jgi:hypothetical protein
LEMSGCAWFITVQHVLPTFVSEYGPTASRNSRGITSQWIGGVEFRSIGSVIVSIVTPSKDIECMTVLYEKRLKK